MNALEATQPGSSTSPIPQTWLTVKKAASHTGLCEKTIRRAYTLNELQVSGKGTGAIRIHIADLDEWMRNRQP